MLLKIKSEIKNKIEYEFYYYAFHNHTILTRVYYQFFRCFLPAINNNVITQLSEYEENEENDNNEENEEKQINATKSSKSDEFVIYLTNIPKVLFCNCGHISICVECDEVKSLVVCPVCKTENTIKRTKEY